MVKPSAAAILLLSLCFHLDLSSAATDTLRQGQLLTTLDTIVSAGDVFELGFFSTGSSYFVGIWYKQVPKEKQSPVWVANRDDPFKSSSIFKIDGDGNLVIADGQLFYKVTNVSSKGNTSVTLLDSGNLILQDSEVLWQSFDHPTDTFLPGMKLGYNKRTRETWSLLSWKNDADPGSGPYSLELDPNQTSQFLVMQGSTIYWTSGTWNGEIFSLVPEMRRNYLFNYSYVENDYEIYFTYSMDYSTIISKLVMDVSGQIKQMTWLTSRQEWNLFWSQPREQCNVYAQCGSFGVCRNYSDPICGCLKGFEPRSAQDWSQDGRSVGCVRKTHLQCESETANQEEDKFEKLSHVLYPAVSQDLGTWSAENCKQACLNSCSCSAYAYNGSGGCSIWKGSFLSLRQLIDSDGHGKTMYVRLAASEFSGFRAKKFLWVIVLVPVLSFVLLLVVCSISKQCRKKVNQNGGMQKSREVQDIMLLDLGVSVIGTGKKFVNGDPVEGDRNKDPALPFFSFASIAIATNKFSLENKLGQGGFGPVYKGKILNGHEIAVKRLSGRSGQGLEELKNEAMVIAKLQHRNLVRLLGCCLDFDERILIYEYMPNKSLDFFLFDPSKRGLLDWQIRARIIDGIAQGLLYLHQYSRLRIIHRDLKASNILLDCEMNPKISDFGMARMLGGNESEGNTGRIAGTYGYMPPEYALEGLFSVKSDVFSFGVLLLEIISGKRNTGFFRSSSLNLLGHAWELWKGDRALELMDPVLEDQCSNHALLRYINVALLCVQENAADRPNMSEVVSMLSNEYASIPSPNQPAFAAISGHTHAKQPLSMPKICSANGMTISALEAR